MARVKVCPRPVARAAPSMPMGEKGPSPKMRTGSRTMLATQPHIMLAMVIFMLPTDWKSFSKTSPTMTMGVKAKATVEYRVPREMTSFDEVNICRKVGIRAMPPAVSTAACTRENTKPWVAAMSALSCSPAPRWKAITALMPTPKPMPTALIRFWMG